MKTALIAGATGLVGSFLLDQLLVHEAYSKVKILVRKPIDKEHPRLDQIVYDYENPATEKIVADDVFCCLGTTIKKAGSKSAFRKVDYDYPLQIARAASENGCQTFSIITSIGSDPRSLFFYSKVKGEVENDLKKLPLKSILIFQPSMLDGPRKEYRFGEEMGKKFMRAFRFLFPLSMRAIHVKQVAMAMIHYVQQARDGVLYVKSGQMQKFAVK